MNERIVKTCSKHGDVEHVKETNGYYRCKRCRNDHVTLKRRKVKLKLIEHFGGKCVRCGYNKYPDVLEFHHRNPEEKKFGIGNGNSVAYEKLLAEATKCDLLCANCHREKEVEARNSYVE